MYHHNPVFSPSSFSGSYSVVTVIQLRICDRLDQINLDYLHHIKPPNTVHEPAFPSIWHMHAFLKWQTEMLPQTTGQKKGKWHVEYRMRSSEG